MEESKDPGKKLENEEESWKTIEAGVKEFSDTPHMKLDIVGEIIEKVRPNSKKGESRSARRTSLGGAGDQGEQGRKAEKYWRIGRGGRRWLLLGSGQGVLWGWRTGDQGEVHGALNILKWTFPREL